MKNEKNYNTLITILLSVITIITIVVSMVLPQIKILMPIAFLLLGMLFYLLGIKQKNLDKNASITIKIVGICVIIYGIFKIYVWLL